MEGEQLEIKPVPICDGSAAGGGFTHHATLLALVCLPFQKTSLKNIYSDFPGVCSEVNEIVDQINLQRIGSEHANCYHY